MNELAQQTGTTQVDTYGGASSTALAETASTAMAAAAKAEIEAGFVMAMRRPRDLEDVRVRLLKDCERPMFADDALFTIPNRGTNQPTIRLMEAVQQRMGNLRTKAMVVYDDDSKMIISCTSVDLENNNWYTIDAVVEKLVERKQTKKGQQVLGERLNTYNEKVYLLRATKDEMRPVLNSEISKCFRSLIGRHVPKDILEECVQTCIRVNSDKNAKDPEEALRTMIDGFKRISVMPSELKKFLGCELAQASPQQVQGLRRLWKAIDTGETTWQAVMAQKEAETKEANEPAPAGRRADNLADKVKQKAGDADTAPPGEPM